MPITENASIQIAMSPYTKQIGKRLSQTRPKSLISTLFCCVISIIGSHPSAEIGNCHWEFQNLVPFITQTGFGLRKELAVYGDDYPTPDGTAL
jgi:UDP-glucose 4-epimerase